MANLDLSTVELVSTLRAAPQNGSPSSQDYNDSWTEALADLAALSGFLNDILIPMLDGLAASIMPNPNGSPNGLEGRYIFSDTSDLTPLFFDGLSSQPLSLADSLRILQGVIQTIQTSIGTLNVEVTALQTQLSSTNQNDIAQALQNFAASLQSLTSQTVANTTAITDSIPTFKTEGVLNAVQNTLNLKAGTKITVTNLPASGDVQIDAAVPTIRTNGVDNSTQAVLNLVAGANITLSEIAGSVTITSTGGGGGANIGGVSVKTADYLILAGDSGVLLVLNSATAHTFTLPSPVPSSTWFVIIRNENTGVLTVARNTRTIDAKSSDLNLSQGDAVMVFADGTNYEIGAPRPYDMAVFTPGLGSNAQILARFNMVRTVVFPASAPNSQGAASATATASATYTFKKNGSSFATVNFAMASAVGIFTQASDAVFAPGDLFEIDGPGTADATLANVGFTLQGYRF